MNQINRNEQHTGERLISRATVRDVVRVRDSVRQLVQGCATANVACSNSGAGAEVLGGLLVVENIAVVDCNIVSSSKGQIK